MKSVTFAPAHISGFFSPVLNDKNYLKSGSIGAGITLSLGAYSEVTLKNSQKQKIEICLNNQKYNSPLISYIIKQLLANSPFDIKINTLLDLPLSQGFGMSAASAVSVSYALTKLLDISQIDAIKVSHIAEIYLKTGLSDVIASSFGGIEIRRNAGLPPWGFIEHIPGNYEIVLCIIGDPINTRSILSDQTKCKSITKYGRYCTKKLLEKPSIEQLISLSQYFMEKTQLGCEKVIDAINATKPYGLASMCMLGNSIFAIGDTKKLIKSLSPFGKIVLCQIDETGARILQ